MFKLFGNKKATEKLFEQNVELAVKNKTLSLLEKLYQTSVLTLNPQEMAREITDIIRKDLNLELAGVLVFKKDQDALIPLVFSKSERLAKALDKLGFLFSNITIKDVSKRDFFKKVIYMQSENVTNNLQDVWQELVTDAHLEEIKKESHIKTILLNHLIVRQEVFGVLLLGFNRDYQTLNAFEKASIKSSVNVIALLLDKAYLYKDLQDSYEVTKKAYAVEKQAKEELQNLDTTKNQFLLTIQHHLRTPLTAMMGYSDMLASGAFGKISKKPMEVVKKFQASTQNLIKMVNEFLDITQFQLGKDIVSLQPGVDLQSILEEIVSDLKFKTETKGISLILKKPKNLPTIKADRQKLKAALQNIFDNAVNYTPEGSVTILVEAADVIKITVTDTGVGIPKERMENLFNRTFERGENAKKTFATGTGLGLFLSNKIILAHHGKIWAESKGENQGSVFHVELPIG